MKKITALLLTLTFISAKGQDTLYSRAYYDEFGNLYGVFKSYECTPTPQDSLDFEKWARHTVHQMMDSIRRETLGEPRKQIKTKPNRKKS